MNLIRSAANGYRLLQCPWFRGKDAIKCIAAGIAAMHEKGVIHLDLKSPNCLISGDWGVKIADLGLGKMISGLETIATQMGTLIWMAPEHLLGTCGRPSDIFSFGTIMYEVNAPSYIEQDHKVISGSLSRDVMKNSYPRSELDCWLQAWSIDLEKTNFTLMCQDS